MPLYRYLSALLAAQLMLAGVASAQQHSPSAAGGPPMITGGIRVLVLEGNQATNDISHHLAIQPVVEVRDENDRPIEGASVVFRVPPDGPGGIFAGGKQALTVKTNVQGQAAATGFTPNDRSGSFNIHVTATAGNRIGEAVISQTNSSTLLSMAPTKATRKKPLWRNKYVIAAVAGAAIAGIVVGVTRGSSSAKNPTVSITPGPITISQ